MSKTVPLTVYRDGRRVVIGTAEVSDSEGTVTCNIEDETVAKWLRGNVGSFSVVPNEYTRTDMCWDCANGSCSGDSSNTGCYCCLREHQVI
jgi:hypothetical protein